jgi:hypothetical protein
MISPALSPVGSWITFVTDRPTGAGLSDVVLYDRKAASLVELPELNIPHRELNSVPIPDGRYPMFDSGRLTCLGERDLFQYVRHPIKLFTIP